MRVIRIDTKGNPTVIYLESQDFDSCVSSEVGGFYRMISAAGDPLLDGTLMICDREEFQNLPPNAVASFLNISAKTGRNIYGTAILAKLGKTEEGYGITDFEDRELSSLMKLIKSTGEMIYG